MSKKSPKRRSFEIRKKQKRRKKIKKLKEKYFSAKETDKMGIVQKIKKIAPHLNIEKFLRKK